MSSSLLAASMVIFLSQLGRRFSAANIRPRGPWARRIQATAYTGLEIPIAAIERRCSRLDKREKRFVVCIRHYSAEENFFLVLAKSNHNIGKDAQMKQDAEVWQIRAK
jgi:hypothetical protein